MNKTNALLIERCRTLRKKGFTLGEIVETTGVPKTTVYGHVCDIPLSRELQERIKREATRRINEFNIRERKGKCIPGRIVPKPKGWSNALLFLTAHFMFDGEIRSHSCIYHNRNKALINRVEAFMEEIFHLNPRPYLNKATGVSRISYHYVELASYMREKARALTEYIATAPVVEKRIFLQAFFDDEGCASWRRKGNKRREIRGYQYNREILKLVQKLLSEFGIRSRIDEKYKELIISKKENLIRFRNKINFSRGIYINPDRKNSIWKRKLEKREILEKMIHSYIS